MARRGSFIIAVLLAGIATMQGAQAQRAPAAAASTVPPIGYVHRVLPNGLNVYTIRDTRTANVSVQMWYNVGSKDDPAGRSGFAHLFEHILSRVTRNIPHGELSRIVEEGAGGTRNASTGPDMTNYYETVPANQVEAMLWAHAERMGRSVLDQAVFDVERSVVQEEMRQRVLSQPYGRLQRYYLFDNGFTGHPYRRTGIGTITDLNAATLADARAFHANFYRPDNATLIVSGNFDQAELDRMIDRHLGALPRPATPILRHRMTEPPRTAPRAMTAYGPNVPLPAVGFAWQRPRLNHADSAALAVIDKILSGGQSSRLYRTLVYERQLAQNVDTLDFGLEDAGIFAVQAIVASGRDIGETETALAAEFARLRDAPVSAAELEEARNEIVSETLSGRETPEGRAFELGQSLIGANDPRWGDRLLAAVRRVTPADVQRVARLYFADSRRVSLRYLDEGQRPSGQAAWDPSAQPTDPALGRTFPPDTRTPNTLAPEAERQAPPAAGQQRPFAAPTIAERRLSNGMRVVVARSTDVPVASMQLVFGGGSSADPAARPGVASMMANLADNGAAGLTAPQIAARVELLGASIGGAINQDFELRLRQRADRQYRGGGRGARPGGARARLRPGRAGPRAPPRARPAARPDARSELRRPACLLARGLWRRALRLAAGRYAGLAGGADPRRSRRLSRRLVAAGQCHPDHHRLARPRGRLRARRAAVRPVGRARHADAGFAREPRRHGGGAARGGDRQSGLGPGGGRDRAARRRPQRPGLFPARASPIRRSAARRPGACSRRCACAGRSATARTAACPPIATRACWSRSPRPATMPRPRSRR